MKIRETRRVSKSLEKKTGRVKKADWIRQIQKEEGNFDCLFTANEYCDQWNCYFREECLFRLKTWRKEEIAHGLDSSHFLSRGFDIVHLGNQEDWGIG